MSQPDEITPPREPDFAKADDGLLPAIAQDVQTGEVLMMAYMNDQSYAETLRTGCAVYFSRSRSKLWRKGEESGNVQEVIQFILTATEILFCSRCDKSAAQPVIVATGVVSIGA